MSKWITIALLFLSVGGVALAAQFEATTDNAYVSCADKRVSVFGYGNRSGPVAELAAIVRWREEAEEKMGKPYSDWALATDRNIHCARWRDTPYSQCRIFARPCKPKNAKT